MVHNQLLVHIFLSILLTFWMFLKGEKLHFLVLCSFTQSHFHSPEMCPEKAFFYFYFFLVVYRHPGSSYLIHSHKAYKQALW